MKPLASGFFKARHRILYFSRAIRMGALVLILASVQLVYDIKRSSAQVVSQSYIDRLKALGEWQLSNGWLGVDAHEPQVARYYPMGIATFARGYASLFRLTGEEAFRQRVIEAVELLKSREDLANLCLRPCWGLPFSWYQLPEHHPYAITTIQVGLAILEAYDITQSAEYLDYAHEIGRWLILENGYFLDSDGSVCFWYAPADVLRIRVHNVNAMAAGFLAWLGSLTQDPVMHSYATLAYTYTVQKQQNDGSWIYDEDRDAPVIEYHTGYVLEGLSIYLLHSSHGPEDLATLRLGANFYIDQQIMPNGMALYRHRSLPPPLSEQPASLWGQAWAVGALTLVSIVLDDPSYLNSAERTYEWMYGNLLLDGGVLAFLPNDLSIYIRHEGHVLYGVGLLAEQRARHPYKLHFPLVLNEPL